MSIKNNLNLNILFFICYNTGKLVKINTMKSLLMHFINKSKNNILNTLGTVHKYITQAIVALFYLHL
jgi:hypothetical protein